MSITIPIVGDQNENDEECPKCEPESQSDISQHAGPAPRTVPSLTLQTAPGLELLNHHTDNLYIIRRPIENFPLLTDFPTRSFFEVYNGLGHHIYTLCQTDPPFKERKFVMYIFAVPPTEGGGGPSSSIQNPDEPILKIFQRCPERPEETDKEEIYPYRKIDQELKQINHSNEHQNKSSGNTDNVYKMTKKQAYYPPRAHVHVRHSDGDFLGHIWKGKDVYKIFNSNLRPIFTIPKDVTRKFNKPSNRDNTPSKRKKVSCMGTKWRFYDYFPAGPSEPFVPQIPLGRVECFLDMPSSIVHRNKIKPFTRKDCSSCSFPPELTPVEKCLVLSFTLSMYCRTSSKSERLRQRCFFVIVAAALLAVVIIVTVGGVCEIDSNFHCKVLTKWTT